MKSAPQTVWQFYIIAKNEEFVVSFNDIDKGIFIFMSFLSSFLCEYFLNSWLIFTIYIS